MDRVLVDTELLIELQAPATLKWIYQTIESLCDEEADVFVECDVHDAGAVFKVTVAREDVGKVIGKHGNHARAIRTLLYARGKKDGVTYALDLREGPKPAARPGGQEIFADLHRQRSAVRDAEVKPDAAERAGFTLENEITQKMTNCLLDSLAVNVRG